MEKPINWELLRRLLKPGEYRILNDGRVDVEGDLWLTAEDFGVTKISEIAVFRKISGLLYVDGVEFDGAVEEVDHLQVVRASLEGGPKKCRLLDLYSSDVKSLAGSPVEVDVLDIYCCRNLESLAGGPKRIRLLGLGGNARSFSIQDVAAETEYVGGVWNLDLTPLIDYEVFLTATDR